MTGRRVPNPTRVTNVIAIQRGSVDPNRVVIISGHIDSRVTDPMNATADAPGANDDGSGTAAVIEAARVLSKHKFPYTIVFAPLSGEEQGLLGGKILADYAKAQGWEVIAKLNNDIVGNSCSSDGICDDAHVRVFSEGLRWQGGDADVVVENFRSDVMEGYGLGFADLEPDNPRLVYCSISGFGGGEGAAIPGYDLLVQAMSGLMSITGEPDGDPQKVGVAVVDVIAGLYASVGILGALAARTPDGGGQRIEVSLLGSILAGMVNQSSAFVNAGVVPGTDGKRASEHRPLPAAAHRR